MCGGLSKCLRCAISSRVHVLTNVNSLMAKLGTDGSIIGAYSSISGSGSATLRVLVIPAYAVFLGSTSICRKCATSYIDSWYSRVTCPILQLRFRFRVRALPNSKEECGEIFMESSFSLFARSMVLYAGKLSVGSGIVTAIVFVVPRLSAKVVYVGKRK